MKILSKKSSIIFVIIIFVISLFVFLNLQSNQNDQNDILLDSKYIFKIGKPFVASFASIYGLDRVYQKSVILLRVRNAFNACSLSVPHECPYDKDESAILIEFQSPSGRDVLLTTKTKNNSFIYDEVAIGGGEIREFNKYRVKLLDINFPKKEVTLIVEKAGMIEIPITDLESKGWPWDADIK